MKKSLLIFILLAKTVLGQSQTGTDTICPSVATFQKLVIAAEQKKVLDEQVKLLNSRIFEKEQMINLLLNKDKNNLAILATYDAEIKTMKEERTLFEAQVTTLNKIIKKEKRKRVVTGILGVIGTGMAFYLGSH